jgi:hypothetical protein
LLKGINNNIGQVVTQATNLVVNFLRAIANNLGRIITAGGQILISLLKGIGNNIASVATSALNIVAKFLGAIASGYAKIVTTGLTIVLNLLRGIASKVGDIVTAGTNIIVHLITGIGNAGARLVEAGVNAIIKFINAVAKASVKMIDAGMKVIIYFLNGVAKAINDNAGAMRQAGLNVGVAIVNGMTFGLLSKAQSLYNQAESIISHTLGILHKIPGIHSPSTVTYAIGDYLMQGLANGMTQNASLAYASATATGQGVIDMFKNVFQIMSPSKVMYDIGRYVGQGFADGLHGSGDDINSVFRELNNKLTDAMRTARETITSEEDKLAKLRAAKKPDAEAIAAAQKIIEQNQALLDQSTAGHNALVGTLKNERIELVNLAANYEDVGNKLKNAQDVLKSAIQTRNEAQKNYADQYATLPELKFVDDQGNPIDPATVVSKYLEDLKGQTAAVGAYNSTLQQLRKLGLDDATSQKLLTEGTADQSFANQLLAGGKTAVEGLNTLDKQLKRVSGTLATNAAKNLYQAGVDSAEGVVKGLESKRAAIKNKMDDIAQDIINTLKRDLKIKSPSQVMAELGGYAMEGFAQGIFGNVSIMRNAVSDAVSETLAALKASMKKSTSVNGLNLQPVITPVLDLSQVKAASGKLAQLTDVTAYAHASAITTQQLAKQEADAAASGPQIKFEQNNYSPEALSEIDIYRNTKNQLSQLRTAFAL